MLKSLAPPSGADQTLTALRAAAPATLRARRLLTRAILQRHGTPRPISSIVMELSAPAASLPLFRSEEFGDIKEGNRKNCIVFERHTVFPQRTGVNVPQNSSSRLGEKNDFSFARRTLGDTQALWDRSRA